MRDNEIKKKEYIRPEVEVVVFNYKDVVAASGEDFSIGVGDVESEIGSGLSSFSLPAAQSDSSVWDTGSDGDSSDAGSN